MNRVVVHVPAVGALDHDRQVLRATGLVAEQVADLIASRAPRDTGAGADSIHSEPDPEKPGFRVSWGKDHFYMAFHELGTEHQPARPFARPVADEINRSRS